MQTLHLATTLISEGHRVVVVCYFEFDESVKADFESSGAIVTLMKLERKISPLRLVMLLRSVFLSVRPDVVHVQYMAPGALPVIAARLAGIRTVFATVHQPCTFLHGRFAKIILRSTALLTTKFIAVSLSAETSWFGSSSLFNEKDGGHRKKRHLTIYNSIDTEKIQHIAAGVNISEKKSKLGISNGTIIIGAVSRLRHEKGIDILAKSFVELIKKEIDAHLLIVGSGPDEKMLKQFIIENGISERVTFYGEARWDEAMALMTIMDIVVVPSRFEGFGLTAAEAMAMGKPVIASDCYGLREIVIDKITGFKFKTEKDQELTKFIMILLSDQNQIARFGIAGKNRIDLLFNFLEFSKKIKLLYN